jgi:iron complex outermembrane receptor protein
LYAYKPEYSHTIEAGIKNILFNERVHLNFTVFVTGVNDVQVPTLVLPDAITVTKNTGKLSSKGAELELMATPVKGLHVDYNFGYTNATYTALKVSQNGTSVDLSGNKQLFTPDVTSMLAIQYAYTIGKNKNTKLLTRFEWRYLGNQYFDLTNKIMQGSYSLINLRMGVTTKYFDLFLWNRNAGNIKYIAYAYDFGGIHLGDPSTFGTTLSLKL